MKKASLLAYLIYFPESKAIKWEVVSIKFTDSNNSPLMKQEAEQTELLDYISNTYEKLKDNLNTEGERQIRWYST